MKRPRFACRAGTEITATGERGAITLLFRNRVAGDRGRYIITCAHVAGDLGQSPPADTELRSACCGGGAFARTLVNSVADGGIVEYDVALGELSERCTLQVEHRIEGSSTVLRRLKPAGEILPGSPIECAFPASGILSATVASDRRTLPLTLDGVRYEVRNLFLIDAQPVGGDSGGLVYSGQEAVGILVGKAGDDADGRVGWGLFQPLEEAVEFLGSLHSRRLRCFD